MQNVQKTKKNEFPKKRLCMPRSRNQNKFENQTKKSKNLRDKTNKRHVLAPAQSATKLLQKNRPELTDPAMKIAVHTLP